MERLLLSRLMYRIQDRLSPRLFGFLPQRSTHHCLVDLYSRLSQDSVVAFIDLKSAFDIANRDIILDQLVEFGILKNLLVIGPLVYFSVVCTVLHEAFILVRLKGKY